MTRDEHIKTVTNHLLQMDEQFKFGMYLYDQHIKPLEAPQQELQNKLTEAKVLDDFDKIVDIQLELENLSEKIRQVEKDCGLFDVDKVHEDMAQRLTTIRENAKIELTEYEYYSSTDLVERYVQAGYYAKNGLVRSTLWLNNGIYIVYNLNCNFDEDKHLAFVEGITPFLENNDIINGIEMVKYSYLLNENCFIACDKKTKTWYVCMEADIIFEHDNIQDIFEYFNLVR